MKPATSLCCLRRSVETRRCTKTSPPTATTVATATIRRPVRTRIIGNLLPEQACSSDQPLGYEKEHDAKCRLPARTSQKAQLRKSYFQEFGECELRRNPRRRSSQNTPSTHFGE